jgi:hypothetical protein
METVLASKSDKTLLLSLMASALLFASASAWDKALLAGVKKYVPIQNELLVLVLYALMVTGAAFFVVYFAIRSGDPLLQQGD